MTEPKKILMIRLSAIGDVVRTLPSLHLLRKRFPEAWIAWAVEEKASPILEGNPHLNEIIIIPRQFWAKSLRHPLKWSLVPMDILKFLRELGKKRFDAVLDFHSSIKSGILSWSTKAKVRIGYAAQDSREINYFFNNIHISLKKERMSRMERNASLLQYFKIPPDGGKAEIAISSDEKNYIERFLEKEKLLGKKKIFLFPGASKRQSYKKWGHHNYAQLSRMLLAHEVSLILGWGPGEKEDCERILAQVKGEIVLSPPTSLKQLAELIKRCDLFIGGDTAAMHISCAVGTPCVAIYGPTDPVINAPWGKRFRIIYDETTECSPCRKRRCRKRICFEKITPEWVYKETQGIMESLSMN